MTNAWLNMLGSLSQAREYLALARLNKQAEQVHRDWTPQDEVDCYHLTVTADERAREAAHYRQMAKQTLIEIEMVNGLHFVNDIPTYPLAAYIRGRDFQEWAEYKRWLEHGNWPFSKDVWK